MVDSLAAFVLDGHTYFARWCPDEWALDAVVVTESGQWAFANAPDCVAAWPAWQPDVTEPPIPADFDAVRRWVVSEVLRMPTEDLLDVWNFTGDVARGVGIPWHQRGRLADRVFDKLTFAAVPWLGGRDTYAPRWSPREWRVAKRIGAEAVALLRRAMAD